MTHGDADRTDRLIAVDLADDAPCSAELDQERRIAIYDLVEETPSFRLKAAPGPYRLRLALSGRRVVFALSDSADAPLGAPEIPAAPLRKAVRTYFGACDSYYDAIRRLTPAEIEAIDDERRALHNDGAALLREHLSDSVEMDDTAARRLFTVAATLLHRG